MSQDYSIRTNRPSSFSIRAWSSSDIPPDPTTSRRSAVIGQVLPREKMRANIMVDVGSLMAFDGAGSPEILRTVVKSFAALDG